MLNIKDIWFSEEYSKVRENENIKDRLMFVTFGGSHSYGTNIESSDVDVRGVALNTKSSLIGLHGFDQVIDNETDTTIYAFNKIISLIINCNPNTIEMLGCKPDTYYFPNSESGNLGKLLIENKKLFLSKRCVYSFGGYANQQLRRLQNAIAHDSYNEDVKSQHLKGTLNSVVHHFNETYKSFDESSISVSIVNDEVVADINLNKYPVNDFTNILSEMSTIVKEYNKLNGRNKKKDDLHLNKHAMHLIRLYLMCFDILEKGEINTYRENDKELLLSIRNGKYMMPDGTYDPSFFELINKYEERLKYDSEHTDLPKKPDMKKIEEFVYDVNYKSLM